MAKRSRETIEVYWLLVDLSVLSGSDRQALRDLIQTRLRTHPRLVKVVLSATLNVAGDEALVKVAGAPSTRTWWQSAPTRLKNAVTRIFTEADHDEAVALVHTREWVVAE